MTITISEQIVQFLEKEKVKYIFGVPGEENEDLLMALEVSSIEFVPTRHEQGAAFIANVMGRLSQKAAFCLSTLGPGASNLITGLADANLDGAPVVAITAQGSTDRLHHESHQLVDVIKMFEPFTKWNTSISNIEIGNEVLRKAINIAEEEKPGVTHIELPEDISSEMVDTPVVHLPSPETAHMSLSESGIKDFYSHLHEAKKPLILAGNGVVRSHSSQEVVSFCELHNIPLVNTFMAKGVMPYDHPLYIGTIGLGFKDYAFEAIEEADLILTIGYDIVEYEPKHWNPNASKKIIHLGPNTPEIYDEYILAMTLKGRLPSLFNSLLKEALPIKKMNWHLAIKNRVAQSIQAFYPNEKSPMDVAGVLHLLREALPHDGIVLSDVGSHKMWIARNFISYQTNTCIIK